MIADVLRGHLNGFLQPTKCSMGKWLEEQDAEVQTLFEQLAVKPSLNTMALYRSLAETLPFKSTTFKLHIKGNCTCPKTS
jgi:hypothetical protein